MKLPRIVNFDNRDPDKHPMYPFPMPTGVRVAFTVKNGVCTAWSDRDHTDITGFAPSIEAKLIELSNVLISDHNPGMTSRGNELYKAGILYDTIIHDKTDGLGNETIAELDSWLIDDEWPTSDKTTCALILCAVSLDCALKGKDTYDVWLRRSHLKRGLRLMGMGLGLAHINPRPTLRHLTIAPHDWDVPDHACAGRSSRFGFWTQVENCFKKGYAGCLIIDVWQGWNVTSNSIYQLIREDDIL